MKNESRSMNRDVGDYLSNLFLDCATELDFYYRKKNPDLSPIVELLSFLQKYQEAYEQVSENRDSLNPLHPTVMCALHSAFQKGLNKVYPENVEQYSQLGEDIGKIRKELSDLTALPEERIKSLMDFCMTAQKVCESFSQRVAYHPI